MSSVPSDLLSLFPTGAPSGRSAEREPAPGFERQLSAASGQTDRDSSRGSRPASSSSSGTPHGRSVGTSAEDSEEAHRDHPSEVYESDVADSETFSERLDETADEAAAGEVFVTYVQQDQNVNAEIAETLGAISTDEVGSPVEGETLESVPAEELVEGNADSELVGAPTETLVTTAAAGGTSLDGVNQTQQEIKGAATESDAVETTAVAAALDDAQRADAVRTDPIRAASNASEQELEEAEGGKSLDLQQTGKAGQLSTGGENASDRRDGQSSGDAATQEQTPFQTEFTSEEGDAADKLPPIAEELTESKSARSREGLNSPPSPEPASSAERNDSSGPLERLAAGRMQTARSEAAGETGSAPRVDASRFVNRVSRAVQTAQQQGGEIRLRLSPPELGSLQIKLTLADGAMTATLETETASAKHVLLDNLPALRERLAEQEIRIEKFDVDVRQEGRSKDAEDWRSGERESSGSGSRDNREQSAEPQTRELNQNSPSPSSMLPGDGAINLIV